MPKIIPSKEDFVAVVKHALTREVDFEKCFSEVAKEQFYNVLARSELTVLWTDGDDSGVPEYYLPGSREQIIKVAKARFFNEMRREIALNRGNIASSEVLNIVATEKKMRFIPKIIDKFKQREIERVIIIEDRLKNLIEAENSIHNISDMDIVLILIKKGQLEKNVEEKISKIRSSIYTIDKIDDLLALLEAKRIFDDNKKVGTIFDMDGFLSDDSIRKDLQNNAVINSLKERDWV